LVETDRASEAEEEEEVFVASSHSFKWDEQAKGEVHV